MKLLHYCLLALLWPVGQTYAQKQATHMRPLTIGDTLPGNLVLENILNYTSSKIHLPDLKNKLIILDFMRTNCKSCLEDFSKLNTLKNKYGKALEILLVTPEPKAAVTSFSSKNKIAQANKLPVVTQDSLFTKLFPHVYIPHEVWIKNGVVIAITKPDYVTDANIQAVLSNEAVSWPVKREIFDFKKEQDILSINERNISEVSLPRGRYHSAVLSHLSGISKSYYMNRDSLQDKTIVRLVNYPIIDLYLLAFQKPVSFPKGRILLEVVDTNRIVFNPDIAFRQEWLESNTYTYEGIFPFSHKGAVLSGKIGSDLDFYFSLSGELVTREVDCYVLTYQPSAASKNLTDYPDTVLEKTSLRNLMKSLNNLRYGQLIIDETGLPGDTLLPVPFSQFTSPETTISQLSPYGFSLTTTCLLQEVLVINDKK